MSASSTDEPAPSARPTPGFSTRQLHAGQDFEDVHAARATPIYLSAGFVFDDFDHAHARFAGEDDGFTYTRHGNPTCSAVERRLAALEGGTDAILVASGQAAVASTLLGILAAGDHLVCSSSIYEGTRGLLVDQLARFGVDVTFVPEPGDPASWAAAVTPATRAFFAESIPNPKNDVLDIAAVADVAHAHGAPLVVDNTLATPYLVRPLEHGADLVVHSASKFLAGHGSVLGGFIVAGDGFDWGTGAWPHLSTSRGADGRTPVERHGRHRALIGYLRELVIPRFGSVPSPLHAFLIEQGLETLALRVQRQSENALAVARWLRSRPEVLTVDYAGLPDSPHHATARRYLDHGYGSVFAFTLAGGEPAARRFHDAVEVFTRMTHLGDVRSLILHPASTTHVLRTADELAESGIWPGLLRVSIGIEDLDDLIADLARGLAAVRDGAGSARDGAGADARYPRIAKAS